MFDNIKSLKLSPGQQDTVYANGMISGEGETMDFRKKGTFSAC